MIKLEVQPYCQNCLVFDPDVEPPVRACTVFGDDVITSDTIIRCSRRKTCAGIKRYLEKELSKGE